MVGLNQVSPTTNNNPFSGKFTSEHAVGCEYARLFKVGLSLFETSADVLVHYTIDLARVD